MNFDKEHNVFSGIPGFDASKGEGIVKALQRLWKKIKDLEQTRISERESLSKETGSSSSDGDLTVSDIQYKLLVLQLQYVRSILRKKLDKSDTHSKVLGDLSSHTYDRNNINNGKILALERKTATEETQTGNSLIGDQNYNIASVPTNRMENRATSDSQILRSEGHFDNPASSSSKNIHRNTGMLSKPHYHLKLDDVPFILGASSTASHSVVANVQNIIAMMKSHNKVLCGPKQNASRLPRTNSSASDSQDVTKMLNELSQDLYELALKQEKLVQRFDAAQGKEQSSNFVPEDKRRINKPVNLNKVTTQDNGRCRSNSESSIKLQTEKKNFTNAKERDTLMFSMQQKQKRNHSSNLPIMARRKLLRSLQNFKTHLSEEDISWD